MACSQDIRRRRCGSRAAPELGVCLTLATAACRSCSWEEDARYQGHQHHHGHRHSGSGTAMEPRAAKAPRAARGCSLEAAGLRTCRRHVGPAVTRQTSSPALHWRHSAIHTRGVPRCPATQAMGGAKVMRAWHVTLKSGYGSIHIGVDTRETLVDIKRGWGSKQARGWDSARKRQIKAYHSKISFAC